MTFKERVNEAVRSIIQERALKYSAKEYDRSPQTRFKVILDRMSEMGHNIIIQRGIVGRTYKKGRGIRTYRYNVIMDFVVLKQYKTSAAAKAYILRIYMHIKSGKLWPKS